MAICLGLEVVYVQAYPVQMSISDIHTEPKMFHDDVIKWKHFPRYWPFVRGIHRSPVNSPHKGQWRGALVFSFICVWINGWVNNRKVGDLRRYRGHYDVTVMILVKFSISITCCTVICHFDNFFALSEENVVKITFSFSVKDIIEAARFFRFLWNLTGTSAALLPTCLSNFKATR